MRPEGTRLPAEVRTLGYVRVSTERQAGEVYTSLADQERAIRARATRLGVAVDTWYRDEGASGATVAKRPEFRRMLADCEASPRGHGAPGLILVLNDSRFGRFPDPDEAAALRFRFKQAGWVVRFCESDDSEDLTSRSVMRAIGSAQASEYRKQLQQNSRRGKKGTAEQGYWTTRPPLGYLRKVVYPAGRERVLAAGVPKATDEKVILVPDPATAPLVQELFTRYARGEASLSELAATVRARVPGRWRHSSINLLLKNPAYLGHVVGGKRAPIDPIERAVTPKRTRADWYGKRDAHEPLVDQALFDQVQARLVTNKHERQRMTRTPFILSGLLTCSDCGAHYTGAGSTRANAGKGKPFQFYRHRGPWDAIGAPRCPGKIGTVGKHLIEPVAIALIADAYGDAAVQRQIRREVDRLLASADESQAKGRTRLAAEARTLAARRDRLTAAIAEGVLTPAEAAPQLEPVRTRLAAIEHELLALAGVLPLPAVHAQREQVLAAAADLASLVRDAAPVELRTLLRPWVESMTFNKTTRELALALRLIPALPSLPFATLAGQTGQGEGRNRGRVIVRRVVITPTAARRAADGAA